MKRYNVHEAKTHLSRILTLVEKGESVIIGRAGKPVATLSPYQSEGMTRMPGTMKGRIQISEDFDSVDDLITQFFDGTTEQDPDDGSEAGDASDDATDEEA